MHAPIRVAVTPVPEAVGNVAADVQVREQVVVLVHDAEVPLLGRQPGYVLAATPDASTEHRGVPGDGIEEGRLSAAGGPDDQGIAALRHLQRDVLELEVACPDAELLEANHRAAGSIRRTSVKTSSATSSRITAAGTAAGSPKAVNRSKMRMLATFGL